MDNEEDTCYDDIIKESKALLEKLYSTTESNKPTNTVDAFRGELLTFIGSQLDPIKRTQALIDLVDAEIVKNVVLHLYDKNELLVVRRDLIQSANSKTQVLLDPFKPTTGGGNSLILPPSVNETQDANILEKLTPDQRTSLDKLMRIVGSKKIQEDIE